MKTTATSYFLCFFLLLSIYTTKTKAQTYTDSQTNGANGLCVGCNITTPENIMDGEQTNYEVLNLTVSDTDAYIYQTLKFSIGGSAGDYLGIVVEDTNFASLDTNTLKGLELTTYNGGISNNDLHTSLDYSIYLLNDTSSQYVIEFQAEKDYDAIELKFKAGIVGTSNSLRVYYGYQNGIHPLPIELISFTATPNNNVVDLEWATATESNNDFFTLEHSTNGVNYNVVGTIKGAGNSTSTQNYTFTDTNPTEGVSYYRLKQTDYNGQYKYFNSISTTFKDHNFTFNIFQNPVSMENIHLKIHASADAMVTIFSEDGKKVFSKNFQASDAQFDDIVIMNIFSPGVYFISIVSDNNSNTQRLVVQ